MDSHQLPGKLWRVWVWRDHPVRTLPLLLLALGFPLEAQGDTVAPRPHEGCFSVTLEEDARPAYTVSGSWMSPDELVLVDALENRLLRVDARGRLLGLQSKSVETTIQRTFKENFLPISIQASREGVWLELVGGRLVKLASAEKIVATKDLWGTQLENDAKLIAILGWTLAGSDIFGYGNFEMADKLIKTGFFRINLEDSSDAGTLRSLPNGHPTQLWYRLGLPFVTSIGDTGYALTIDKRVSIVKSPPGVDSLINVGSFTGPLRSPPTLPPFETPDDFVTIMEKLSSTTAPMGLYGWNGKLYLLWRYNGDGSMRWFLSSINPQKSGREALEATAILSSRADHVMVIPGSKYWAFVEKGPVRGYLTQSTTSVIFVPTSRISKGLADKKALCGARD